jgi:aspartyl-tRNA(Asn)/glutamyl-tRNA(Gln) amidotransferase subunit A
VEDAAYMLAALAGDGLPDAAGYVAAAGRRIRGVRVGVPRAYFFDALEPGVARAVDGALDRLRAGGAIVRDVALPVPATLYDTMFAPIAVAEIRRAYAADWVARPDAFSRDFAAVFAGPGPSAAEVTRAREARVAFERTVTRLFDDVDVLAMPTVPMVAPPIDSLIAGMHLLRNTWPFNAARGPAISVPCGSGDADLPVGLQLVARPRADDTLLRAAAAVAA